MIDPTFRNITRLFVISFKNDDNDNDNGDNILVIIIICYLYTRACQAGGVGSVTLPPSPPLFLNLSVF